MLTEFVRILDIYCYKVLGHLLRTLTFSCLRSFFHNFDPSPEEEASWMSAEDNAQALIDLLEEGPTGRTGEDLNFCVGRPVKLEPPNAPIYILQEDIDVVA